MDKSFHLAHQALFGKDFLYELVQDPLWYQRFGQFTQVRSLGTGAVAAALGGRSVDGAKKQARERLYEIFEDLLEHSAVALGGPHDGLYNWDSEREAIDTIVVHHSNRSGSISLARLNAMELLRLYVPAYQSPSSDDAPRIKDKPIYSGHIRMGHQNFFPYHWIIRQDGTSERLLQDHQIGWHAGNWDVNKRSIALCFDDNLSHKAPSEQMLVEARRILYEEYSWLNPRETNIHGHAEYFDTECPGDQFTSGASWKQQLLHTP